jgi:hypothetical protein
MEIYTFLDFIPQYQCNAIIEFVESSEEYSGTARNDENVFYYTKALLISKNLFIDGLISLISDMVRIKAEELFKCNLGESGVMIAKTISGHSPEEHADSQNMDGTPKDGCSDFHVSAVVYLNDNFEGGELVFPKIKYSYKPVAGSCIMFPSNIEYSHYVASVTSGERLALPFWFPGYEQ